MQVNYRGMKIRQYSTNKKETPVFEQDALGKALNFMNPRSVGCLLPNSSDNTYSKDGKDQWYTD